MTITVLDDAEAEVDARVDGEVVHVSADDLETAVGWAVSYTHLTLPTIYSV